jgi:hypothetical protein
MHVPSTLPLNGTATRGVTRGPWLHEWYQRHIQAWVLPSVLSGASYSERSLIRRMQIFREKMSTQAVTACINCLAPIATCNLLAVIAFNESVHESPSLNALI